MSITCDQQCVYRQQQKRPLNPFVQLLGAVIGRGWTLFKYLRPSTGYQQTLAIDHRMA